MIKAEKTVRVTKSTTKNSSDYESSNVEKKQEQK